MKIKEKERSNLFLYLKKVFNIFIKSVFNKKIAIIFWIILLVLLFIGGILFGLLTSSYFGTIDNPSPRAVKLMNSLGFMALKDLRTRFEGIKAENIMIPINYIKGKFSKTQKIYIDIGFKDYKKLEYKRQQALDFGFLDSSDEDFVPATIKFEDKELRAKIRLKGDLPDHFEGDKWSFRIKIKNDKTLFGLESFSIQDPDTRNYLTEWIYHRLLEKEDLLHLKYDFVEIIINGKNKGIYALEEHFDKQLMTSNKLREGVIIKFDEDVIWEELLSQDVSSELDYFYTSEIQSFQNNTVQNNPELKSQFETAKNLLDGFRKEMLTPEEVFDTDKLARYFAINTLIGSPHGSRWHNIRFYYNPLTSKLEPIGWDQYSGGDAWEIFNEYASDDDDLYFWWDLVFKDDHFKQKYFNELERISDTDYLQIFFLELEPEIEKNVNILRKDDFLYYFSTNFYYRNQEQIKERLRYFESLNEENSNYFEVSNKINNNFILRESNLSSLEFLEVNFEDKEIIFKEGLWKIKENLIIPKGFTLIARPGTILDLTNNSTILSYSNLKFIGSQESPVKVITSDNTGEGIIVLNSGDQSVLNYVEIIGQSNPFKQGFSLTGAITFYKSNFTLNYVLIEGAKSEDSLDGISSFYQIQNSIFSNCFSDCLDDDFGGGSIENSIFRGCGNDCIDISGTEIIINDVNLTDANDKGLSIGEESKITVNNLNVDGADLCIAVKDLSILELNDATLSNCNYGFAIYQKKSEFGPSSAVIEGVSFFNVSWENIVERDSKLSLNNKIVLGTEKDVYKKLYGETS
jgi:hypothetical protein